MPQAYFFNIGKRANSTSAPALNTGVLSTISIKESCSVENPTILLHASSPPLYNYFYLPDFGRYYFVTGRTFTEGLWNIAGEVDPLASHRAVIMANSGYCMYSASRFNNKIMDSRIQQTASTKKVVSEANIATPSGNIFSSGTKFIVACGSGISNLYKVSDIAFSRLGSYLDSMNDDIIEKLQKKFGAVQNSILGAYSLPINDSLVSGTAMNIHLGDNDTGVNGTFLSTSSYRISGACTLSIPWEHDDFRRLSPYTTLSLFLPFVGLTNIATADVLDCDSIEVYATVNMRLGTVYYKVIASAGLDGGFTSSKIIGTFSASIKTTIPISTYSSNVMGEAGAIASVGGSVLAGAMSGGIGFAAGMAIAGGVVNATASSLQTSVSTIGGYNGSGGEALGTKCALIMEYHESNVEPSTLYPSIGGTLFERVNVGSLSGFAQFNAFTLSGGDNITLAERDRINSYMNGGVYIE